MTANNTRHKPDIRIGTIVGAGMKAPEYIRQILPYGFESFSLYFGGTTKGLNWKKLAAGLKEVLADSAAVISFVPNPVI